jgi:4-oxalocrotonate tautomerase
MPIVQIHLMEGRTKEKKAALVKKVTEAIIDTLEVKPENIRIILSDMKPENYAISGTLIIDTPK